MWPAEQLYLSPTQLTGLAESVKTGFNRCVREQRIEEDLTPYLKALYLPLADWLMQKKNSQQQPLVVGICGGQGSGKSTSTALLSTVLQQGFGCRVASLSIDDIYKTHAERQKMAAQLHPMFATRGVPMTHDVELGRQTLDRLSIQATGEQTRLPSFDKAQDDRADRDRWPVFEGPADIIILEGWCVGAIPQDDIALGAPINALERDEDAKGIWRRNVNQALATEYKSLFELLDVLILLKVESMEKVFKWRRLQERKLQQTVADDPQTGTRVMSKKEVDRFIMHYERLTRHILQEMPERADIVLPIDDTHNPASVRINRPIRSAVP